MERITKRKWLWIAAGLIVVVAIVAALFLWAPFSSAPQAEPGETVEAFIGDLADSATASGSVVAPRQARLALATGGRVETVYVEVGDVVESGHPLVQLEDGALQRAVARAEQNLAIQEANLESLLDGPSPADLTAAEAAVESAQAQLNDLLAAPTDEEIAAAEANVRAAQANLAAASRRLSETQAPADQAAIMQAQVNLEDAQEQAQSAEEAYIRTLECETQSDGTVDCEPRNEEITRQAELNVVAANERLAAAQAELDALTSADEDTVGVSRASVASMAAQRDAAQANLDLMLAGPTEAEIAAARATLADRTFSLASLHAGPTAAQIATAEAGVEQAHIALERARNDLEEATLRAPFAGVVTAVHVDPGELASGVAVELEDAGQLEVVLDVDEVDVGELAVGQPAVITLEAWPEEEIESEVVAIAPAANGITDETATLDSGIATFQVRLALGEAERPVRVGMTANASLVTAQREDVLLVPNRAIIADRAAGRYYVNLVEPDAEDQTTVRRVEVSIGLRDSQYTQITDGLEAGDRVRIGSFDAPLGNPFGEGPPGSDQNGEEE
ncbi:MAG: efflux RND transporter periplasmic adaptor subunit [Candidatus Promineifilaceae bacterium]|nr:efflux RND transporter periplasmic adaptor subunit [Candidatus Promineifilaceae bacterium]